MASNKQKDKPALSPALQAWEAGDAVKARALATGTDEAKVLDERSQLPPLAWWLAAGVATAYTALVLLSRTYT
jgi:hypothetical protein